MLTHKRFFVTRLSHPLTCGQNCTTGFYKCGHTSKNDLDVQQTTLWTSIHSAQCKAAHYSFRTGNTYHQDSKGNFLPILPRGDPNKPRAKPRFSVADLKPEQDPHKDKRDEAAGIFVRNSTATNQTSDTKIAANRTFELVRKVDGNSTQTNLTTSTSNRTSSDVKMSNKTDVGSGKSFEKGVGII